jgi:hypothetical protein
MLFDYSRRARHKDVGGFQPGFIRQMDMALWARERRTVESSGGGKIWEYLGWLVHLYPHRSVRDESVE